jgi:hypothetical protein
MLNNRDIFNIWMDVREKLEMTGSFETTDWDDDLGIVSDAYDTYRFQGVTNHKGNDIYLIVETKYNEISDTHYDIEVSEVDAEDDVVGEFAVYDKNYTYPKLELAFEEAESHIKKNKL